MGRMSLAKGFALTFGVTYLAVGLLGFAVTGLDDFARNGSEALLIFEVNPFHNLVHVGVGAIWMAAAAALPEDAHRGVTMGIGIVYSLATVLGAFGYLQVLSIDGLASADNFLHLATALAALGFGAYQSQAGRVQTAAG